MEINWWILTSGWKSWKTANHTDPVLYKIIRKDFHVENGKLICYLRLQQHISATHYGTNTLETKRLMYDIDFLLKN